MRDPVRATKNVVQVQKSMDSTMRDLDEQLLDEGPRVFDYMITNTNQECSDVRSLIIMFIDQHLNRYVPG